MRLVTTSATQVLVNNPLDTAVINRMIHEYTPEELAVAIEDFKKSEAINKQLRKERSCQN